jgi:lysophospholipase L1-like esterase
MKTILCYGDSNTWGFNPATQARFPRNVRWPGVLRRELGDGYEIVEEGLCGRTTTSDDPIEPHRSGLAYLPPCIESHKPLHLVILMLGTNDLKLRFSLTAQDIARGAGCLIHAIKKSETGADGNPPAILLISPPPLAKLTELAEMFEGGTEKSARLARRFSEIAQLHECHFLDAGEVIQSSEKDGIHFEASEHQKLGIAVATRVKSIFATNN